MSGKILLISLFFLTINSFADTKLKLADDQCYSCHEMLEDEPAVLYSSDIHFKMGISCASCHGGNNNSDDMEEAMNPSAGFIGVPRGDQISEICVKCHSKEEVMKKYGSDIPTNQMELLEGSVHGKLSTNGKDRIVQCITCHGIHKIAKVDSRASLVYPLNVPNVCAQCHSNAVFMRNYNPGLPVDQLQKYRTSVHGVKNAKGDSKVAECASCHGSHGIKAVKDLKSNVYPTKIPQTCAKCHNNKDYMSEYNIPTDQYNKYVNSVHGIALLEKNDVAAPACNDCHGNHSATPPGVESISQVCGNCHALNAELFSDSPHKKAFDENDYPECETCHSNHEIITASDKLLGVTDEAVCSKCHTENENKEGFIVAKQMRILVDSLQTEKQTAKTLVNEAEQKGMEISEAKFKLRDVDQAIIETNTMVHSFSLEKFKNVVGKGFKVADNIQASANDAIDEFYFRRIGLGISVFIMILLAVGLYFYIRRIG